MQTIKLSEDVVTKLERLQYEVDARRGLIESKNYDLNSGSFKTYHDEYINKHVEFEQYKDFITKTFVAPNVSPDVLAETTWNVDFATQELTF